MSLLARLLWPSLYIGLIPLVNWLFTFVPAFELGGGWQFHPLSLMVGAVFIARDFAQRAIGHGIFIAMGLALAATIGLAGPALAFASGAAFLVSETADWAVYTFTRRPLWQRVLVSSLVAAPIDTFVFLYGASYAIGEAFTWSNAASWIAGKFLAAIIVALIIRRRENAAG